MKVGRSLNWSRLLKGRNGPVGPPMKAPPFPAQCSTPCIACRSAARFRQHGHACHHRCEEGGLSYRVLKGSRQPDHACRPFSNAAPGRVSIIYQILTGCMQGICRHTHKLPVRLCSAQHRPSTSMRQGAWSRTRKVFARGCIQDGACAALGGLAANRIGERHIGAHGLGLVRFFVQGGVCDACTACVAQQQHHSMKIFLWGRPAQSAG